MIRAFHTGRTGASEHQKLMAVAANNMANVNTDGYKTSNLSFQELIYQRVRMPDDYERRRAMYDERVIVNRTGRVPPRRGYDDYDDYYGEGGVSPVDYYSSNKLRVGAGGRANETAMVMTQGAYRSTDSRLDVLIRGEAFFAVMNRFDGEIAYTRNGSFAVSNEDGYEYLVTANGEYVLDENYDYILMPEDRENLMLISHFQEYGEEDNFIRIGLFTCDNIYGLERIGENRYSPTEFSGEMELETREGVDIIQYGLEASNVNIAEEMLKVIQAQRAFQSNLTVVRTADEIEAYTNQLRQ
ncbi:MAG: flagellar hook-basal body protein [Oscillospiraceae bacterium]|nr:flagellar hook-basal body protein [Oscillospiraceae bacterium]